MKQYEHVEEGEYITTELCDDGWYYMSIGYRFHGTLDGELFTEVWDMEET